MKPIKIKLPERKKYALRIAGKSKKGSEEKVSK